MTSSPIGVPGAGQKTSLCRSEFAASGQNALRSAVKPTSASGASVIRPTGASAPTGNVCTTPCLPSSKASPGPSGMRSAKNCVTNTVSSASSLSPSLVTATAYGLPPTSTVSITRRAAGSTTLTTPPV